MGRLGGGQFDGADLGREPGECRLDASAQRVAGAPAAAAAAAGVRRLAQGQRARVGVEADHLQRADVRGAQRAVDAGPHVIGVQVVQDQQSGGDLVVEQRAERVAAASGQQRDDLGESGAVELHQGPDQLLGGRGRGGVDAVGESGQEFLDPGGGHLRVGRCRLRAGADCGRRHPARPLRPVGTCIFSTVFPPPTYMCTPQGRQGSKLRTARMMSMPLKFSGGFSSKIGVFCTASS